MAEAISSLLQIDESELNEPKITSRETQWTRLQILPSFRGFSKKDIHEVRQDVLDANQSVFSAVMNFLLVLTAKKMVLSAFLG